MINRVNRCRAETCNEKGKFACHDCGVVFYCCKHCQENDWFIHSQLCYSALDERLVALYNMAVGYDEMEDGFNLSKVHTICTNNDSPYNSNYYGEVGVFASKDETCACCEDKKWDGSSWHYIGFVCFEGVKLTYAKCVTCDKEERSLCGNTLCETTQCQIQYRDPLIAILFFLKCLASESIISFDVMLYTMSMLIETIPCKSCK